MEEVVKCVISDKQPVRTTAKKFGLSHQTLKRYVNKAEISGAVTLDRVGYYKDKVFDEESNNKLEIILEKELQYTTCQVKLGRAWQKH
jgi:transposase